MESNTTNFYQNNQLDSLSPELIGHIFKFLPLQTILLSSRVCKSLYDSVYLHLKYVKSINLSSNSIYGVMLVGLNDETLHNLLGRCPNLESLFGFQPLISDFRNMQKQSNSMFTIKGIVRALTLCPKLKFLETSNHNLIETVSSKFPTIWISGIFQNILNAPVQDSFIKLSNYSFVYSLKLNGVTIFDLPRFTILKHLYLENVTFTSKDPFKRFEAKNLEAFSMKRCNGITNSTPIFYKLLFGLASSINLKHLEFVDVELPGGMIGTTVTRNFNLKGFRNLSTIIIAGCKQIIVMDLGILMLTSCKTLKKVYIQPSLCRDFFFSSLDFSETVFTAMKELRVGYDEHKQLGSLSNPENVHSCILTHKGIDTITRIFPYLEVLSLNECPYLNFSDFLINRLGTTNLHFLKELYIKKCPDLKIPNVEKLISYLPNIEIVCLEDLPKFHVPLRVSPQRSIIAIQLQDPLLPAQIEDNEEQINPRYKERDSEANSSKRKCIDKNISNFSGPLTRGRIRKQLEEVNKTVANKSCQVTPFDIETDRHRDNVGTVIFSRSGTRWRLNKRKYTSYSHLVETCDIGVGTVNGSNMYTINSLHINSKTLQSLTLINCEVFKVHLNSQQLIHFEVKNCNFLEKLDVINCPNLSRINILSCPKLIIEDAIKNILNFPLTKQTLFYCQIPLEKNPIFFKTQKRIESAIFSHSRASDLWLSLVEDRLLNDEKSFQEIENFYCWIKQSFTHFVEPSKSWIKTSEAVFKSSGTLRVRTNLTNFRDLWCLDNPEKHFKGIPNCSDNMCDGLGNNSKKSNHIGFYVHYVWN